MKVIKIDVKQEILDVEPRPCYYFHKLPEDYLTCMIDEDSVPADTIQIQAEKYRTMEFFNPYSKEGRIRYLIKFSDDDIVNNLVKIENDVLATKLDRLKIETYNDTLNRIKKLTWWRRLFNKF